MIQTEEDMEFAPRVIAPESYGEDSDSDIENLPTSKEGKGELEPTAADSMAVVIGDGGGTKILLLNGNDEWVEV